MTFAKINCGQTLGAGLVLHTFDPPTGYPKRSLPSRGTARISFGDPTARTWPEIVALVRGEIFLFAERIVNELLQIESTGIEFFPIEIGRISSPVLEKKKPPTYRWSRITGEVTARVFAGGAEMFPNPESGRIEMKPGVSRMTVEIDPNSWDGSDFFAIVNCHHGMRFCSERIIEAATKYRWQLAFHKTDENYRLNL
jgi:hypothetical protein